MLRETGDPQMYDQVHEFSPTTGERLD